MLGFTSLLAYNRSHIMIHVSCSLRHRCKKKLAQKLRGSDSVQAPPVQAPQPIIISGSRTCEFMHFSDLMKSSLCRPLPTTHHSIPALALAPRISIVKSQTLNSPSFRKSIKSKAMLRTDIFRPLPLEMTTMLSISHTRIHIHIHTRTHTYTHVHTFTRRHTHTP